MSENDELRRLADSIELYVEAFDCQPPSPPFVPISTLIMAYEHAVKTGDRLTDNYFPGFE